MKNLPLPRLLSMLTLLVIICMFVSCQQDESINITPSNPSVSGTISSTFDNEGGYFQFNWEQVTMDNIYTPGHHHFIKAEVYPDTSINPQSYLEDYGNTINVIKNPDWAWTGPVNSQGRYQSDLYKLAYFPNIPADALILYTVYITTCPTCNDISDTTNFTFVGGLPALHYNGDFHSDTAPLEFR